MAAPVDAARNGTNFSTAATPWSITVGSPAAGTLLIVLLRGSTNTISTFTGYTQLAVDTTDASDDQTLVYYRWADGTEGATDDAAWSANTKGSAICWQITGAINPATSAPTISTVAVGTTAANSINPASVAPANAPQDTLYIALGAKDGTGAITVAPTNYSNLVTANSGSGAAAATNSVTAGATRGLTASSSEDPGVFTHIAASNGWAAYTVAVIPPAAAAPPLVLEQGYVDFADPGVL